MPQLKKIDLSNVQAVTALQVREDQQHFVASNAASIIEAFATRESGYAALPFAICEGEEPVGFAMFGYGYMEGDPAIAHGNYVIVRLMIDRRHQGKGLGKAALEECLRYLRTCPCGPATHVWLSYEPDNSVARSLYHQAGFRENGEMCGGEVVAMRAL